MKNLYKKLSAKYRLLTASQRPLPDFLIIGTQKGGTTSLYEYLKAHAVLQSNITAKEVHFFDEQYDKGEAWYRSNFPKKKADRLYYEASPYYIIHPLAPQRIAQKLPDVKLIALLRNPIDRAYSSYQHQVRAGREELSFEEAIAHEAERLAGEKEKIIADPAYNSYAYRKYSYIERGKYIDQIQNWHRFFKKEQLLILSSEAFWSDPEGAFKEIFDFLGVEAVEIKAAKKHNTGNYKSKMDPDLRKKLHELYRPYNDKLFEYLGKKFDWSE